MTNNGRSLLSLVLLSGASVLVGAGPGFGQGLDTAGICFTEQGRQNIRCACLDETGTFDPNRRYGQDNARLCANLNDNERAELTEPEITGSITPPDEVIDPTDPPGVVTPPEPPGPIDRPPTSAQEDNGIGNGIDPAPGRSDVTNGDVADGADSGGPNPKARSPMAPRRMAVPREKQTIRTLTARAQILRRLTGAIPRALRAKTRIDDTAAIYRPH